MEKKNKIQNKDKGKRIKDIPEKKKKELARIIELMAKKNTIMVVSIENISVVQFHKIKKATKDKAIIKVVKKSIIIRAIEEAKKTKKNIDDIKDWLKKGFAIMFSDLDPFELSLIISENKFPAKVKEGQITPKDIIIEAGATDLPAGPIISELAKLKIKAGIEAGKISIKETSIAVKEKEKITKEAASILTKLDITPFKIGFEPLVAYDTKEDKIYKEIKIDKEALIKNIQQISQEAFNLALSIEYSTKETIIFIIAKANHEANIILNLIKPNKQEK